MYCFRSSSRCCLTAPGKVNRSKNSNRPQSPTDLKAVVKLWQSVPPPIGLLDGGDEEHSEIDVVIEASTWVWFIEAKYKSDISPRTTTRPERDQIIRNVDVGSYYAGVRTFSFSTLIAAEKFSAKGVERIEPDLLNVNCKPCLLDLVTSSA
jgi:hypothetical protein